MATETGLLLHEKTAVGSLTYNIDCWTEKTEKQRKRLKGTKTSKNNTIHGADERTELMNHIEKNLSIKD